MCGLMFRERSSNRRAYRGSDFEKQFRTFGKFVGCASALRPMVVRICTNSLLLKIFYFNKAQCRIWSWSVRPLFRRLFDTKRISTTFVEINV